MKKLFAMILALVMILSLATTAFAATTVSLDITHIAGNHTFKAYQLFDGDLTDAGILSNIVWGPGVDGDALLAALKADTTQIYDSLGVDYVQFSTLFASAATAADVVSILESFSSNGARLDHFAKIASDYVVAAEGVASGAGALQADNTYKYTIADLDPGYYIVIDETAAANVGSEDYKTRYILSLTTHTSLVTKGSYTTVEKGVSDTLDGTYTEHITNQLYKPHYFEIRALLDDDLEKFDAYYLKFTDTMSKGYEFLSLQEVYVEEVSGDKVYLYQDGAWVTGSEPTTYSVTVNAAGETIMVVEWEDLKAAYGAIAGDDEVVITYSAWLTEDAVIGSANPNEVFIDFSNGPDTDDHGTSIPDYAYVFPFGIRLNKVDADNNSVVLPDAKFVLYHLHGTQKFYATNLDANNKIQSWTPYLTEADMNAAAAAETDPAKQAEILALGYAHEFVTDADGNFYADGLDADVNYYLHETVAPAGYNLMFTDIKFSIHPTFGINGSGEPYVQSISYQVDGQEAVVDSGTDFEAGRIVVTALNDKGNTLPSTGGIGTTLFYILGSVLVVGAAVLLVTKKRMSVDA